MEERGTRENQIIQKGKLDEDTLYNWMIENK